MNGRLFEFVAAQEPECTMVYLNGEIDFAAALEVGPRLEELAACCDGELGFDLDGVTFIDSEGIKMLLKVFHVVKQRDCSARICKLSARARRVMEMAGVDDLLLGAERCVSRERRFAWRIPGPLLSQR